MYISHVCDNGMLCCHYHITIIVINIIIMFICIIIMIMFIISIIVVIIIIIMIDMGDGTVGNPHRAQNSQFELFELVLWSEFDRQLSVERFEATASQSTVPSPPLDNAKRACRASGASGGEQVAKYIHIHMPIYIYIYNAMPYWTSEQMRPY